MKNGTKMVQDNSIVLSGMVVSDADAVWYGDAGGYFTPGMVRDALSQVTGAATVRISSEGGDPFAGEAVRSALAQHPGGVVMVVEGLAASAASLIFMAGLKRSMSKGSMLMIHDPSMLSMGNEADMLKSADTLGKMADTYAAVYGAAAGMTAAQARDVMRAETWLSADEAVALGFATDLLEEGAQAAMTLDAGKSAFRNMQAGMVAMIARKNSGQPEASAAAGGSPAMMAIPKEAVMPEPTPAAVTPVNATPVATVQMAADAAILAERTRQKDIRMMAAPFLVSGALVAADVDALIDAGTPASDAGQQFMTRMAAAQPAVQRQSVSILRDERTTAREGMTEAIYSQMVIKGGGKPVVDKGMDFMNMSIVDMAAKHVRYHGKLRSGHDRENVMMIAGHSTSDFPAVLANALNKRLLDAYSDAAPTFQSFAQAMSFTDFRPHPMTRVGDYPLLQEVGQGGEIKYGTIGDSSESVSLKAYGIAMAFNRQVIVNDDLGAMNRIAMERGRAVARTEDSLFYAMMLSNSGAGPTLTTTSRGVFNTTDVSKASTAAAITVASLGIARGAIRKRTGLNGAILNLPAPSILLVGPDKETEAQTLVYPVNATQASNVNPFSGKLNVVVSAQITNNNWYLFCGPMDAPCFVYGYMDGAQGPRVRMDEPFGQQGMAFSIESDFGCGAIDFRGGFWNAGA